MSDDEKRRAFVQAHTTIASPPLCPELALHLSEGALALWEATEAFEGATGLPPPYWAFAWPGGQALARYVLDHPEVVRGRTVLDFASGAGVSAIAAGQAGAKRVVATEIDPLAVAALALNAQLDRVTLDIVRDDVTARDDGWEVVLAGDVCYERPMAELVHRWLRRCATRGATVLLGDPGRNYLPQEGLEEVARYVVPTSRDLEDRDHRETAVWRIAAGPWRRPAPTVEHDEVEESL